MCIFTNMENMTAQKKAKELIDEYKRYQSFTLNREWRAKQCALITVEEIRKELINEIPLEYWQQVKTEINKL